MESGSGLSLVLVGLKVMLAASYWSLLAPEIEIAEESGKYGAFAFLPVAVGFTLGVAFIYGADILMPTLGAGEGPHLVQSGPQASQGEGGPSQPAD